MNLSYGRWLLGALLLPVVACGGLGDGFSYTYDSDAGTSDASYAADGAYQAMELSVLAPSASGATVLVPGEVLRVHVKVVSLLGQPIVGERLEFALIGQPMDSTLETLHALTDDQGEATVYVRAGQTPTTFQLRVSVGGATSYLIVEVHATQTSAITVTVDPQVASYVKNVHVEAYAARTCAEIVGVPPSAEAVLDVASATLSFTALSTDVAYAVVASATDATGAYSYSSCIDVPDVAATAAILVDFGLAGPSGTTTP